MESTLEQLQIGKGGYLTVVDEENPNGDRQTVTLYVKHSTEITEFSVDPDCELSLKPQVKQATGKRKAEDEADGEPAAKELKTETIVVVEDDVIVVE